MQQHTIKPGRPGLIRRWLVNGALVCAALALFAWGAWIDGRDADATAAYERGVEAGRKQMRDTVRDAYAQGQRDAVEATSRGAGGVQLAATCMAWWYAAPIDKATLRKRVCGSIS